MTATDRKARTRSEIHSYLLHTDFILSTYLPAKLGIALTPLLAEPATG